MTDQPGNSPDDAPLENTPFVLYPLRVPRGTQPVVGGDCGAPRHIFDPAPNKPGLKELELQIDPFLSQQRGDRVAINANNELDIVNTLTQSDNDTVTLYLPEKMLEPDIVNILTYTVTRGSQNMGTSLPLKVLYNEIRPGKEDTDPGVEGHSRLVLLLPDAIKNGVGPDFPAAGARVCVSYPYCRAYDVIRLNCNGHDVFHTVTASEAPLPGSDIPVTVCFTVTRADLASGGDSSEFVFSFTVRDQLHNGPDLDAPWSAKQLVDVDLAGTRLPAPILREIQNDPADDPGIIDRDKLAGNPLLVIVLTGDSRFQAGDLIEATYTATIPGQPDLVVIVTGTVETDEFGQKKPCILEVANDKVITNSAVKVAFTLKRGGSVIASSNIATAQVIGSDTIALDPPVPEDNPVDPLAYLQGLLIKVAFAASLPGDQARLSVVNMPEPTFSDLPLDANHQATFNLNARFLGAWHGTAVQFVWALIRGGNEIARSGPLVLNVSRIANGDARLPTPVIAGQVGQELDVTKLVVTDLLSIAQWLLQAAGQYVWLRYDGFNSSGAPVFFDDLNGVPHNETQGLTRPLGQAMVDWLNALKDKTNFTISFRVNFGKVADLNRAVTFPLREYTVSAVVDEKPAITSIKGASNGVEIPNGGTTVETAVVLTGLASKGQKVDVSDGKVSKGQPTADPTTGIWSLSVSGLNVDLYSYTATALYGSGQTSQAWTFTVIALVAPTISSIKGSPSGVEIRQGDYTVETTVVLTGMASKGLQVDVLDGTMSKGKPIANITTGVWTLTLSGLSVGSHRFTVKALYGSIPPSAERQFSIIPPYSRPTITNVVRTDTGAFVPSGSTLPRGVQLRVTGGCYSHPTKSRLLLLVGSNNHNGAVQLGTGVNSYTINEFGWATNAGYATYQARDELSGLLSQTAWGINWV
ncbi:hypothetical protein [Pseudomonas fluorescens]|uniref:Ig-like domain repeat protein n=1 Tax=Pseudomonas fluorescens TaxID=294 RepID=A0A5E7LVQ2_PSEFL|nr:hypothetical protein [Pseudomonas fluorescens]VVP18330.1 hypothetical protein PS880_03688 [Pseudomonas fluorescens]